MPKEGGYWYLTLPRQAFVPQGLQKGACRAHWLCRVRVQKVIARDHPNIFFSLVQRNVPISHASPHLPEPLAHSTLAIFLSVTDIDCSGKFRLIFSSSIKETVHAAHHTKLPLNGIVWNKVCGISNEYAGAWLNTIVGCTHLWCHSDTYVIAHVRIVPKVKLYVSCFSCHIFVCLGMHFFWV